MAHPAVSHRFAALLERIEPTAAELRNAERHAEQIARRLSSDFDVKRIVAIGSHWKGTAVKKRSDLDLFVVLSRDEVRKWNPSERSNGVVRRVRASLADRYPMSSIRRDQQAVTVKFIGGIAVDIVPAQFGGFDGKYPEFLIPDGNEGWLVTSPEAQRAVLRNANARSGNKAVGLVRMLKWWAAQRPATSSAKSLYFEHAVSHIALPVGWSYSECLAEVMTTLARARCPELADPAGVSAAPLACARTTIQRADFRSAIQREATRAEKAIKWEERGAWQWAVSTWKTIFNGEFPS